jgi:tetratricopeptide (TPR) repeat protein
MLYQGVPEATHAFLESQTKPVFWQIGDLWGYSLSIYYQIKALFQLGRYEEAKDLIEENDELYHQMEDKWGVAKMLLARRSWAFHKKQEDCAQDLLEKSLKLAREMESHQLLAEIYENFAMLAYERQEWQASVENFSKAQAHRKLQGAYILNTFKSRYQEELSFLTTHFEPAKYTYLMESYILTPHQIII